MKKKINVKSEKKELKLDSLLNKKELLVIRGGQKASLAHEECVRMYIAGSDNAG